MIVYIGKDKPHMDSRWLAEKMLSLVPFNEKLVNALDYLLDGSVIESAALYISNEILPEGRPTYISVSNRDIHSLDFTLTPIILKSLKTFRQNRRGSPYVDLEDVPKKLHPPKSKGKKGGSQTDSNFHKRWEWVLDEIIWSFEYYEKTDISPVNKKNSKRIENGFKLFAKYYPHLWS